MATRTILKITTIYLTKVAQLFGVWPYFYNEQHKVFKTTWYLKLIPIFPCLFFSLAMLYSVIMLFSETPASRSTDAANFIKYMYSLISFVMFFTSYSFSYIDKNLMEHLTKRVHDFYIKVNTTISEIDSNYRGLLCMCIFKIIVLPTIFVISDNNKLNEVAPGARTNPMLKMFLLLPIWIFAIVPNLFVMGMLVVLYYFRQINVKLREIVRKTVRLSKNSAGGRNYRMKWFCELSDEVDAVSMLHMELCHLAKCWHRLFSLPVCVWTYYKVIFLLLQLFFSFVVARAWLGETSSHNFNSLVVICSGAIELLITMLELSILVHISYSSETEVGVIA